MHSKTKHFEWCSSLTGENRKKMRRRAVRSLQGRKTQKRRERQEVRQKAWGASMPLHFPWTHVRDPLLPSVWWSVAGAMSSQPGESLHGSQHKSPECSKLIDSAMFPPLPHVSKQLSTLCPPCLQGVTLDISHRDFVRAWKNVTLG